MSAARNWERLVGLASLRGDTQPFGPAFFGVLELGWRFAEELVAHDESCEAVRQRIDARALLGVDGVVRPYDVKARVDVGYGDCVQG